MTPRLLIRKTVSFKRLSRSARQLVAEAVWTSLYVKITLIFRPFSKVAKWLGAPGGAHMQHAKDDDSGTIAQVRSAMRICHRCTPWPTECYTQALAARIMLKRRRISSTLFFGFCRDDAGKLKGHAWLQASGIVVTGARDLSQYTIHSTFI